jgi:hypothetical protein
MIKGHCHKTNDRRKYSIISIFFILIAILPIEVFAAPLIIDHTVVDLYNDIPQNWIDSVKKMWATVPGESHSRGYRIGLYLLDSLDSRFDVNIQESGVPEEQTDQYLLFSAATWGDVSHTTGWRYGYGEEDWYTSQTAINNTKAGLTYYDTAGPTLSAMGFGWCWDMTSPGPAGTEDPIYRTRWSGRSYYWNGTAVIDTGASARAWGLDAEDSVLTGNRTCMDTYLQATQQYIDHCTLNGYPTKVFFTTGPIDGSSGENAYQRYLKHEYIRDYVNASSDGILFDYADILSWSNAGIENTQSWTDYSGTSHTFQYIHSNNMLDLEGTYTEDGDHIGQRGALRLGKAIWYMLARIAGWDGDTSGITDCAVINTQFSLYQNYPNPFNQVTIINYSIAQEGKIKLVIYDIFGRETKVLVDEYQSAGPQSAEWDGTNSEGEKVSSGTYFYQIRGEDGDVSAMKMILLK